MTLQQHYEDNLLQKYDIQRSDISSQIFRNQFATFSNLSQKNNEFSLNSIEMSLNNEEQQLFVLSNVQAYDNFFYFNNEIQSNQQDYYISKHKQKYQQDKNSQEQKYMFENRNDLQRNLFDNHCHIPNIHEVSKICNKQVFKKILKIKKIKGKFQKNTNVPKVLVRIYLKHYLKYLTNKANQNFEFYFQQVKQKIMKRKTNDYKIPDIIELLEAGTIQNPNASLVNRQTMSKIILSTMRQQIILNNYVKGNQMTYMIALKVYALRCRSKSFLERVKIL